ncbi:MAG TPA: type I methionyl aminopeptidase [Patescibacteria group bacterium]|nr:type I methionyl aminopeptidase [Patescibacteria group bacterium]
MVTAIKNNRQINAMSEGGKMLATILELLKKEVQVGISTKDIAKIAETELNKLGGESAFLNYQGYPEVICVSINQEIVHGIPKSDKFIKDGDIVSLDFGVKYKGMITDAAISVIAGKAKQKKHLKLIEDTEKSLYKGIKVVKDRIRTGDIGNAIESYLEKGHYGIIKDLVGHGVGTFVHEDPNIPNFGRKNTGPWLQKNMTIAIEPMVTLGTDQIKIADDGWTVETVDGSLAAHFEHTVLITDEGAKILTRL